MGAAHGNPPSQVVVSDCARAVGLKVTWGDSRMSKLFLLKAKEMANADRLACQSPLTKGP
jgi:hypothetical protein